VFFGTDLVQYDFTYLHVSSASWVHKEFAVLTVGRILEVNVTLFAYISQEQTDHHGGTVERISKEDV